MAKYKDTILTAKGLEFATKAANGDFKFEITKVETTGTDLSDKSEVDLKALTALPDVVGTGSIVGRDDGKKDNGIVGTQVQITNIGLEKSYTLNALALWAQAEGEDTEYLYAIAVAEKDHGEYIPDFNDKVTLTFGVTIYIIVGDTDNVTIQFDPAGLATIKFVEDAIAGIKLPDLPTGLMSLADDNTTVSATTKDGEQKGIFVTEKFLEDFKKEIKQETLDSIVDPNSGKALIKMDFAYGDLTIDGDHATAIEKVADEAAATAREVDHPNTQHEWGED